VLVQVRFTTCGKKQRIADDALIISIRAAR